MAVSVWSAKDEGPEQVKQQGFRKTSYQPVTISSFKQFHLGLSFLTRHLCNLPERSFIGNRFHIKIQAYYILLQV